MEIEAVKKRKDTKSRHHHGMVNPSDDIYQGRWRERRIIDEEMNDENDDESYGSCCTSINFRNSKCTSYWDENNHGVNADDAGTVQIGGSSSVVEARSTTPQYHGTDNGIPHLTEATLVEEGRNDEERLQTGPKPPLVVAEQLNRHPMKRWIYCIGGVVVAVASMLIGVLVARKKKRQ